MSKHRGIERTDLATNPTPERLPGDPRLMVSRQLADQLASENKRVHTHYPHLRQAINGIAGLNDSDNHEDLKIVLTHDTDGKHGDFDANNLTIRVNYDQFDENKAQDTTLHELGHYLDETINPLTRRERIVRRLASIADRHINALVATPLVLSGGTTASAGFEAKPPVTELLALGTGTFGAIAFTAAGVLMAYRHGKRERIARSAEQLELPPIFTVEDAPQRH